jgi:Sodium/hydrogen exchanger family
MSTASFNGLLIISVIAVMAPVLAASAKRVKLPSVVVEITAGIIVGPSVLAWVKINQPVNMVALLGLAFLLFLLGPLIVRGAPAALYARTLGTRGAVAAGLLQATSLPVIVTEARHPRRSARDGFGPRGRRPAVPARVPPLAALSVIRAGHIEPAAPHATPPDRGGRGAPHACDDQPVQKEDEHA